MPELYSLPQIAELLGVTKQNVQSLVTRGKLKAEKIGGRYLIREVDFLSFTATRKQRKDLQKQVKDAQNKLRGLK